MAARVSAGSERSSRSRVSVPLGVALALALAVCGFFTIESLRASASSIAELQAVQRIEGAVAALQDGALAAAAARWHPPREGEAAGRHELAAALRGARVALDRFASDAEHAAWLGSDASLLAELGRAGLEGLTGAAHRASAGPRTAAQEPNAREGGASELWELAVASTRVLHKARIERQRLIAQLRARAHRAWAGIALGLALLGVGLVGLLIERRRLCTSRERLRLRAARLAATIDHIRDGVAVFDQDNRLLLWNQAFFPTSGFPPELARTGTTFASFATAAADWAPPLLGEARPHDEPVAIEAQSHGKVLEVWRSALSDGGQIMAVTDISHRVETEQLVRQAQKMDALGQLTGGIAHDMNNLLQVISANLEQLASSFPADGEAGMRLDAAMAGVARGANLTRHLLAFARRQPLATEVIEPGELIRGTADLLRRTLGETYEIRLALEEEEERWFVRVDPQQLENAVLNLVLNARDAMPNGGRVVVIVTNRVLGADYAHQHQDASPGEYVMIAVADTGQGMSAEQIARAAEPFYTTKGIGRGTGLGLSMVYGLVHQSAGHLHIDSVPGGGTTVRMYLPRTRTAPSVRSAAETCPRGEDELVLVVEDDVQVRAVALASLKDLGYRTLAAANADGALELLRGGARPNILFSDVVMPGSLDARDLEREARKLLPAIGIIFSSGYSDNPALVAEIGDPSIRVLPKPWTKEALAMTLREVLQATAAGAAEGAASLKVLLVEDEPMVGETTAELLTMMTHDVRWATTVAEARNALEGAELVIVDAGLPDGDGAEFAETVRREKPELAVIVVSGRSARRLADPAIVWLEKPFDEAKLGRAIAQARAGATANAA